MALASVPGINWTQVTAEERARLKGLIAHYAKNPHPFTACVADNTKRFGPERARRICAVLKDLIHGGTDWRKGKREMAEEIVLTAEETRAVIEQAEAILREYGEDVPRRKRKKRRRVSGLGRAYEYNPSQLRAAKGTRIGGRWIDAGSPLGLGKSGTGGGKADGTAKGTARPAEGGRINSPGMGAVRGVTPGKLRFVKQETTGGVMGKSLPRYDVYDKGGLRVGEVFQEGRTISLGGSARDTVVEWRVRYNTPDRSGRLETVANLAHGKTTLQERHDEYVDAVSAQEREERQAEATALSDPGNYEPNVAVEQERAKLEASPTFDARSHTVEVRREGDFFATYQDGKRVYSSRRESQAVQDAEFRARTLRLAEGREASAGKAEPRSRGATPRQREVLDLVPPEEGTIDPEGYFRAGIDAAYVADRTGLSRTGAQRILYALLDRGEIKLDDRGYYRPA